MTGNKRLLLMVLGVVAALFILAQLALGLTIVNAKTSPEMQEMLPKLMKTHQHTGYVTVVFVLTYILLSLAALAKAPMVLAGRTSVSPPDVL